MPKQLELHEFSPMSKQEYDSLFKELCQKALDSDVNIFSLKDELMGSYPRGNWRIVTDPRWAYKTDNLKVYDPRSNTSIMLGLRDTSIPPGPDFRFPKAKMSYNLVMWVDYTDWDMKSQPIGKIYHNRKEIVKK